MTDTGSNNINAARAAQGMNRRLRKVPSKKEWDRIRMTKLGQAMAAYTQTGELIPQEWVDEYNNLVEEQKEAVDPFGPNMPQHHGVKSMKWGEINRERSKLYTDAIRAFESYAMPSQEFESTEDTCRRLTGFPPKRSDFVNTNRVCNGYSTKGHHADCKFKTVVHQAIDVDRTEDLRGYCGGGPLGPLHHNCKTPVSEPHRPHWTEVGLKPVHYKRDQFTLSACGRRGDGDRGSITTSKKDEVTCEQCKTTDIFVDLPVMHLTRGLRNDDLVPRCGAIAIPLITRITGERQRATCSACLGEDEITPLHFKSPGAFRALCRVTDVHKSTGRWNDVTCSDCLRRKQAMPVVHMDVKFSWNTECGRDRRDAVTTIDPNEVTCGICKDKLAERDKPKVVHAQRGPHELRSMCAASQKQAMTEVAVEVWKVTCDDCKLMMYSSRDLVHLRWNFAGNTACGTRAIVPSGITNHRDDVSCPACWNLMNL